MADVDNLLLMTENYNESSAALVPYRYLALINKEAKELHVSKLLIDTIFVHTIVTPDSAMNFNTFL